MRTWMFCLAAVVVFIHCHGSEGYRYPVPQFTSYSWTRTLNDSIDVRETAASVDSGPRIYIRSKDRALFNAGLAPAETIIDFSTNTTVQAVRIGNSACYIDPSPTVGLTYADAVTELESRNGTTVTDVLREVEVNATRGSGTLLSYYEKWDLFNSNPALWKICHINMKIFAPVDAGADFPSAGSEDTGEKVISAVSYDAIVRILVTVHKRRYGSYGGYHG